MDDTIVSVGNEMGRASQYMGSSSIYAYLKDEMGDDLHYTQYEKGEMETKYGVHPHCCWYAVGKDEEAKRWFFENV